MDFIARRFLSSYMQKLTLQIILLSFFASCGVTNADIIALPNQSPIVAIFGLPSAVDFEEPERRLSFSLNVANNFVPRSSNDENLTLDGETTRLVTHYQQRLSDCWMFGVELPIVNHSGGALDAFVDNWHQWFDLPESGRPDVHSNRLLYQYTVDGEVVVHYTKSTSGVGDTSLVLTQRQHCGSLSRRIVRVGVKLPTGDPGNLNGSGAADIFIDLSRRMSNIYRSLDVAYTAGVLWVGTSRVVPKHHRQIVYGALSFELPFSERFSLDAQIGVQSPTIESDLRVLSDWPVELLIGLSMRVSNSTRWNVALSEDPEYGTSSDVVFQFGLQMTY